MGARQPAPLALIHVRSALSGMSFIGNASPGCVERLTLSAAIHERALHMWVVGVNRPLRYMPQGSSALPGHCSKGEPLPRCLPDSLFLLVECTCILAERKSGVVSRVDHEGKDLTYSWVHAVIL